MAGVAAYRVRGQEKFHAFDVSSRGAGTLVHVAASDPLCPGRHSNLICAAVVTNSDASSGATMVVVIARLWRIGTANDAAGMNGVMPVVIMIGRYPIPATVVRFKRVMRPANTSIGAPYHNILAVKSERPDVRRMRVNDSRLDRRRSPRLRRPLSRRDWLRKRILNVRIALDACHVRPSCQHLGNLTAALH